MILINLFCGELHPEREIFGLAGRSHFHQHNFTETAITDDILIILPETPVAEQSVHIRGREILGIVQFNLLFAEDIIKDQESAAAQNILVKRVSQQRRQFFQVNDDQNVNIARNNGGFFA